MSDSAEFTGTRPVAAAHAFDIGRLEDYMRMHVEGFSGALEVAQFKGGQSNPTFLLKAGGETYVMRRKPPGVLLPSAHAVDREYRVIRALAGTDVPVPHAYALCEDADVIGTAFYIMEYVDGRVLWDPALPDMTRSERGAIYDELNRVMAALHSVDPAAVGLADYGKPGNYVERQVARWTKQYRAAETERIEAADNLIEWLPKHLPSDDESRIVHGDYRLDNVILDRTATRIVSVLDWELSTLGHPLVDFSYHCLAWRMAPGESRGIAGLDLAALGIPDEAHYVKTYLERTGHTSAFAVSEVDWGYYLVFNMFRLVGILQGITARALQGNASSASALEAGKRAAPLAQRAWALACEVDAMR
ncbi:phosphotransferase [Pararobbsia silviterrae]|uniref:Phosphotransferase family protein n=1 Tax=Pararobbsia silviterrae TaxID=1792498 RepID=A0A494XZ03_9BURK|nr:phosphotransferase [Pararobbsia silviterrae]RKP55805.1 phosphotransferase family protein [Pararobbsia silviterrae]